MKTERQPSDRAINALAHIIAQRRFEEFPEVGIWEIPPSCNPFGS